MDHERGLLSRHDLASGELMAVMDLPDRIHAAGVGPEATLLVLGDLQEVHVFQEHATEPTVFTGELGPGDMVYGFGSLWLYQLDQRLLRLNPSSGAVEAEIPDTNVDAGRSSCPEEPRHGPHPPLAPANQLIPRLNLAVFADSLMEAETPPLRTSSKRPNPRRRPTSKATLDEKKWR